MGPDQTGVQLRHCRGWDDRSGHDGADKVQMRGCCPERHRKDFQTVSNIDMKRTGKLMGNMHLTII